MKKIHRYVKYLISSIAIILPLLLLDSYILNGAVIDSKDVIDEQIFPHDQVIDVKLTIDEESYTEMMSNAIMEEYIYADVDYNGYQFTDIGIRPKGNSSLKHVASSSVEDKRISFKINLDYYVNDQSLYGITKINLNNLYVDPTMMAEYIGYEMLAELEAEASRTTFVALYINDEYFGLYLAVEQVDEAFLEDRYGDGSGKLYKPELESGSDLRYSSDNREDYGIEPESGSSNNKDIINLMKVINEGGNLDEVMNVDSFLKYLAVSSMIIHLDGYQGGMFHNYYLYNNNGRFEWITWDLNMSFNGFPKGPSSDEDAIALLIDEPVLGPMAGYPLIEAVFQNETYVAKYHEYLQILMDGYLSEDTFNNKVTEIYQMIKNYVEIDPTAFYTYEHFENALFQDEGTSYSILTFIKKRVENVRMQLDGTIPSTNSGQGNAGGKRKGGDRNNQMPPGEVDGEPKVVSVNNMQGQENKLQKQDKPNVGHDEMKNANPNKANIDKANMTEAEKQAMKAGLKGTEGQPIKGEPKGAEGQPMKEAPAKGAEGQTIKEAPPKGGEGQPIKEAPPKEEGQVTKEDSKETEEQELKGDSAEEEVVKDVAKALGKKAMRGVGPAQDMKGDAPVKLSAEELESLLPEGVTMEEVKALLPEGMNISMISRMIPPGMSLEEFKDTIPESLTAEAFVQLLTERMQAEGGPRTNKMKQGGREVEEEAIDLGELLLNAGLAVVGLLGMLIFVIIIKKK